MVSLKDGFNVWRQSQKEDFLSIIYHQHDVWSWTSRTRSHPNLSIRWYLIFVLGPYPIIPSPHAPPPPLTVDVICASPLIFLHNVEVKSITFTFHAFNQKILILQNILGREADFLLLWRKLMAKLIFFPSGYHWKYAIKYAITEDKFERFQHISFCTICRSSYYEILYLSLPWISQRPNVSSLYHFKMLCWLPFFLWLTLFAKFW